jgi:hypothetical protein
VVLEQELNKTKEAMTASGECFMEKMAREGIPGMHCDIKNEVEAAGHKKGMRRSACLWLVEFGLKNQKL